MVETDYVAVYGSLRRGQITDHKMGRMEFVGSGTIDASLFALGWYPGVKLGSGETTVVDVFKLPEDHNLREAILYDLDGYEGYREKDPLNSLFVRKVVLVESGDFEDEPLLCYVYEYNYPVNRAPHIASGDWNDYNQNVRVSV